MYLTKKLDFVMKYSLNINAVSGKITRWALLIVLLEKWKESIDQGHVFEALLADLWKVFG